MKLTFMSILFSLLICVHLNESTNTPLTKTTINKNLELLSEFDIILSGSRIYIQVLVNGTINNFMLDIGASGIGRVDSKTVKDLFLDSIRTIENSDGVNIRNEKVVFVNSLKLGPIEMKDIELLARDYNKQSNKLIRIDGILGRDFFKNYVLELDYPNLKVRIYKGNLKLSDKGVLEYNESFMVKGIIGSVEYNFHFDSGSNLAFHFPKTVIEKHKFRNTGLISKAFRANTEFELHEAVLKERLQIGAIIIDSAIVDYSESANSINVGGLFLRNYELTIDQKNKLLLIE